MRLRREGDDPPEPGAHGLGRDVFMADLASPGLPPPTDPAHGRHHHLVDRGTEAQLTGGIQARPHPRRIHVPRGSEERVDEVAGRFGRLEQEPHAHGGIAGTLAPSDLVAHEAQLVDRPARVPAVAAARARGRRNLVAALP
jgi:hypothetical protein